MDADRDDLIRQLFVAATEIAESAHKATTDGQARDASIARTRSLAQSVAHHAKDLHSIADAILVLLVTAAEAESENPAP